MRKKYLLVPVLALLFLALLAWLPARGISFHAADLDRLFASWRAARFTGPFWCVALQALQVVFFFIPGEAISFAAGYVFGTWHGLAYSFAGTMLGSAFNFYLARAVGRRALARIVRPSSLDRVDRLLAGGRGKFAVFLLFLFPLGPTDALCYGAGFTGMSLPEFAAISGTARFPGLLFSIYLGAGAAHRNFAFLAVAGLMTLATLGAFYLFRRHKAARRPRTIRTENAGARSLAGTMPPRGAVPRCSPFFRNAVSGQGGESSPSP